MPLGPGKYDDLATTVRLAAKAEGAIILVFNGSRGDGFSAQLPRHLMIKMPEVLRDVAQEIEKLYPAV